MAASRVRCLSGRPRPPCVRSLNRSSRPDAMSGIGRSATSAPASKQQDGLVAARILWPERLPAVGERQGWNIPGQFTGDLEGLAAGRQDIKPRAATQDPQYQLSNGIDEMLAVVDDK